MFVNFTSLICNLKNGPKLSHFGRAKLRRSKIGSVSAEQPYFRPKQATFPLNIDTGFIVNAPVMSNRAALGIYSLCILHCIVLSRKIWLKWSKSTTKVCYLSEQQFLKFCDFCSTWTIHQMKAGKNSNSPLPSKSTIRTICSNFYFLQFSSQF